MQKLQLQQNLQQRLTPLQIQQMKLMGCTILELEERIMQELEENPALEEGLETAENDDTDDSDILTEGQDDLSLGDYMNEDDIPAYKLAEQENKQIRTETNWLGEHESFQQTLIDQLHLRELTPVQEKVGEYIIGNIDADGYLRRELTDIQDDLAFQAGIRIGMTDLLKILKIIQSFDPAGVGATELKECMLLQLARKEASSANLLARLILTEAFDEFSRKKFDKLVSMFEITEDELKSAIHEVSQLNPKPGNSVSNDLHNNESLEITPDFLVETIEDEISVSLNNCNIPSLRVSNVYVRMFQDYSRDKNLQSKDNKAAVQFVKQKLDNAKWFIEALHQRQITLLATMEAIVSFQRKFFLSGDDSDIKPMILKDIADKTGLDISTLSRVSNSKYVQCNYGIFPLKYFFTDGIQNESGEEVSTREIKNMLKEAIQNEEKKRPLTDDRLCEILNEKGYSLARRTVAKYRESLGIPVARLRKEME